MNRKIFLVSAICVQLIGPSAFAVGAAGCGLGGMVMPRNTRVSQTLAITTNGTFSSQMFGITTGTSDCNASGIVKTESAPLHFAEANLPQLQGELVRGEGELLSAFAKTYGCRDTAVERFNSLTRANSALILGGETNAASVVQGVGSVISSDSELSVACRT